DVASMGEVVLEVAPAVVEIGDARHDHLRRVDAPAREQLFVSRARDAERIVAIAEPGRRGTRHPSRDSEALHEGKEDVLGISHPLLDEHDLAPSEVLREEQIGAGEDEIVAASPPLDVDREVMVAEVRERPLLQLVAADRELEEAERAGESILEVTVV